MRILGDLDGNESRDRSDSIAYDGESPKIEQTVEPRNQTGFAARKTEHDPRKAYVGGIPSVDLPPQPRAGGEFDHRTSDRIGEQRLERADDIDNRAQLSARRSDLGVWFVLMVLALGLLGVCGYLYLALRNNHVTVSQVPGLLRSIPALGGRLDTTEAKLRGMTANWDGLTTHMADLDHKVDSSLRAARNQTRELVGQATDHLQAELDRRSDVVDARLNHVESIQKQDQAQLAHLNDQLRGQVSSLREQLAAAQQSNGRDLQNS
jgi:F0F1-type ATP synthase membrane subunit b/b'